MGRWFLVFLLLLLVVNVGLPWLASRLGRSPILRCLRFGHLPGDFSFELFGRPVFLPITSTLLLSLLFTMLLRYL